MTSYELISIIIASVSAIIAVLSVLSARKANTLSSSGIETSLRSLIENGRNIVNTISITMAPLLAQKDEKSFSEIQRKELDIYKGLFKSAVESWLNTYEEACAKYIDNKIDKTKTIGLGDQLVTDILGFNRLGVYSILVKTIDKKTQKWYTKINRLREIKILKEIKKINPNIGRKIEEL